MSAEFGGGPGTDELAPVDFLAIEFPGGRITGKGFERLLTLSEQGVIEILDMEFIVKDNAGDARTADISELGDLGGVDLSDWAGASSGLLDAEDIAEIGDEIEPGSAAAVVVFENRWVLGVVEAWRGEGARLIADGGLAADDIVAALNATEVS